MYKFKTIGEKMKNIISIVILAGISYLYGFEVNTHQAITRCALTTECSQSGGISNLENFVKHTELKEEDYSNEDYEKYHEKYIDYANTGTGFKDWKIQITPNYLGMIEAGSVLEDSLYHNPARGVYHDGDGRFNNHFYAVQFDSRDACEHNVTGLPIVDFSDYRDMMTPHTLCGGYGKRTDSIDWTFNKDVDLGQGRKNEYGLEDAFDYFKKSFEGNETERTKYQAKFFVTLGFMSHMLQDLHSPAHVRDGSHMFGDYLEIYGRYDKGFNLRQGNMNPTNEQEITAAISSFDMPSYLNGMNFKSLEDFYYKEASWVSHNFFSESHNWNENKNIQTGEGLRVNSWRDKDTIFDGYNALLSKNDIYEDPYDPTIPNNEKWSYLRTNYAIGDVYGPIVAGHDAVGFKETGVFFVDIDGDGLESREHMIKPNYEVVFQAGEYIILTDEDDDYLSADTTALKDTAVNVIPRAVASTQAFLNFFFRGQIAVSPIYSRRIYIFNDSNTSNVIDGAISCQCLPPGCHPSGKLHWRLHLLLGSAPTHR